MKRSCSRLLRRSVWALSAVATLILALGTYPVAAWHNTQVMNLWGGDGPAIQGFDPVAYFTMGKAVKGSEQFLYHWLGADWHFANAEHRDLFSAEPTKYAPQHGGYCAVGASGGGKFGAEPRSWRIVDGKLYLFYSDETAAKFNPASTAVTEANASWHNQLLDLIHHEPQSSKRR